MVAPCCPGPNFAGEVARGLPAAATLGCADAALGRDLAEALSSGSFRAYWTEDTIGVEVGGALKNVLAIAAGIVAGKGLGENARAALITRGLAELARLGEALGGRRETMMGLSGLGDLVLTATSLTSRNMAFGHAIGQGADPQALRRAPRRAGRGRIHRRRGRTSGRRAQPRDADLGRGRRHSRRPARHRAGARAPDAPPDQVGGAAVGAPAPASRAQPLHRSGPWVMFSANREA